MQLNQEDNTLFYNGYNYDEGSYCQSVLDASSLDKGDHYRLSDVNVIKLLHDHGANAKEWQEDWGGETIFYKGKKIDKMNPEPGDFYFHKVESVSGNRSCLFKNSTGGWHGVKEVNAPVDRQICNVVILK